MKLIRKIHITPLGNIHRYAQIGRNLIDLQTVSPLKEIPFKSGTPRWTVSATQTAAGTQHSFTLSFTAAEHIRWSGRPLILIIEFCEGEKKIIGSPYLPVFVEATETQENETLSIRHVDTSHPRNLQHSVI